MMGRIIKRIVLGVLSLIVVIILSVVVYLHISYGVYPPKDSFELVVEENLTYYNSDYDECRNVFLKNVELLTPAHNRSIDMPSAILPINSDSP